MRRGLFAAHLTIVLVFVPFALGQAAAGANGTIVATEPCAANPIATYDAYLADAKKRHAAEGEAAERSGAHYTTPLVTLSRLEYETRAKEALTIECSRIRYLSDGLEVVGFVWKPKVTAAKKFPLIIFNRGGNREFSKVTPWHSMRRYVLDGFVVVASQYRGNDGGGGQEEFGGADVHDVENLVPMAASLGYVDMRNVFMLGWSRGGMMTALALKDGMKVNAAAIGGPLTNLVAAIEHRPELREVWGELIPGYADRTTEVLRSRSAVYWADQIHVPLLILQGGADWRTDPGETLEFAQALQRAGATYELVVYAGDDHGISVNRADADRRTVEWFHKHVQK
jgi:dipeptidyl aminopeptidase/acylaminoacyl peptidase